MNTSVNLVPFFGVFICSIVQKAYNTLQSQVSRSVKVSKNHSKSLDELEVNSDLEILQSKMGQLVDESEKDGKIQQSYTDTTSGSIDLNSAQENAPTSNVSDRQNTSDLPSDSSITTLCDDQGFKTIIAVNHNEKPPTPRTRQTYLETEIDSYSTMDIIKQEPHTSQKSSSSFNLKPFTFCASNPLVSPEHNTLQANQTYTTVNKSKTRPNVPNKPTNVKIKAKHLENVLHFSTLSLARQSQVSTFNETNVLDRVNSLPNLSINNENLGSSSVAITNTSKLTLAPEPAMEVQYAEIDHSKTTKLTTLPRPDEATEYCEILPESPPYVNNLYANSYKNSNEYESVYEDVTIPGENRSQIRQNGLKIEYSPKEHADYVNMASPISEINFSFGRYENTENISLPALKHPGIFEVPKIYQSTSEIVEKGVIFEPPRQFSSFKLSPPVNGTGENLPVHPLYINSSPNSFYENITVAAASDPKSHSPSSSYAGAFSQYSGSSIASTATSSFQGIQVCYFPPTPPADFYMQSPSSYVNLHAEEEQKLSDETHHRTPTNPSQKSVKRTSRSKISKPLKHKPSFDQIQIPEEPAPPLPAAPDSPHEVGAQKPENEHTVKLSAKTPPSGKAMRWYEKLGCIQTGSLQVSEPYGRPGERKKSKERRRSQFYLDTDDPNHTQTRNNSNDPQLPDSQSTYVNYQDVDLHVPGRDSGVQI